MVAFLALRLRRPVKWIQTRREDFLASNYCREHGISVDVAADGNGRLLGLRDGPLFLAEYEGIDPVMPVASFVQMAVREVAANELQNDLQTSVGGALARVEKDDLLSVKLEPRQKGCEAVRGALALVSTEVEIPARPLSGGKWRPIEQLRIKKIGGVFNANLPQPIRQPQDTRPTSPVTGYNPASEIVALTIARQL